MIITAGQIKVNGKKYIIGGNIIVNDVNGVTDFCSKMASWLNR